MFGKLYMIDDSRKARKSFYFKEADVSFDKFETTADDISRFRLIAYQLSMGAAVTLYPEWSDSIERVLSDLGRIRDSRGDEMRRNAEREPLPF